MNIAKKTLNVLGALALVGSATSSAWAGNCTTEDRAFVNQDLVTVTCKSATGVTHAGQGSVSVGGGVKTIFASKTVGAGLNIVVRGADASGNSLCQAADSTVNGVATQTICPFATTVLWRAILVYNN
jgi:hypothetical protein